MISKPNGAFLRAISPLITDEEINEGFIINKRTIFSLKFVNCYFKMYLLSVFIRNINIIPILF